MSLRTVAGTRTDSARRNLWRKLGLLAVVIGTLGWGSYGWFSGRPYTGPPVGDPYTAEASLGWFPECEPAKRDVRRLAFYGRRARAIDSRSPVFLAESQLYIARDLA